MGVGGMPWVQNLSQAGKQGLVPPAVAEGHPLNEARIPPGLADRTGRGGGVGCEAPPGTVGRPRMEGLAALVTLPAPQGGDLTGPATPQPSPHYSV